MREIKEIKKKGREGKKREHKIYVQIVNHGLSKENLQTCCGGKEES